MTTADESLADGGISGYGTSIRTLVFKLQKFCKQISGQVTRGEDEVGRQGLRRVGRGWWWRLWLGRGVGGGCGRWMWEMGVGDGVGRAGEKEDG